MLPDMYQRHFFLSSDNCLQIEIVFFVFSNQELIVKVQGPRPENILFLIHEVIESLIAEFFFGVTYDFLLPCPDCIKRGVSD